MKEENPGDLVAIREGLDQSLRGDGRPVEEFFEAFEQCHHPLALLRMSAEERAEILRRQAEIAAPIYETDLACQ